MAGKLLLLLLLLVTTAITMGCAYAERERSRTIVTHLKGFDGPLPFSLETGYVEVEETHGVELFYYFIESERNPAEDPVILWISGGPGCSGLNALLFGIGPLKLDIVGYAAAAARAGGGGFPGLLYFEDAWTKVSNVIFLDAPVGAGFSYAREAEGLNVTLTGLGTQLRLFLQRWMARHPQFVSNPLYIGGDSYSGYTVTVAALAVADLQDDDPPDGDDELRLNLKGYLVGNARGQVSIDNGAKLLFMHGMGLISDELYRSALRSCAGPGRNDKLCSEALRAIHEVTSDVNPKHILEPTCGADFSPRGPDLATRFRLQEEEEEEDLGLVLPLEECRINGYRVSYIFGNDPEVRAMLGIREGTIGIGSWSLCPDPDLPHFHNDVHTTLPYHRNLTQRGYRALVYNGDHDMLVPFQGTQAWIRSLGYPVVAPWRPWYSNGEVAGFTTEYAHNLTFATVKGAGHMAPESRPKECLEMITKWTSPAGRL